MDDQEFSGSAAEFLSLRAEGAPDPSPPADPPDTEPQAAADPADATDQTAAEDDDLSPEARVAAALAEDAEYVATFGDPRATAAPDAGDEIEAEADAESAPDDLSQMSPEQVRELAEEALRLRAEMAERGTEAEDQALASEIADLDARVTREVEQRYQVAYERSVLTTSEAHYGKLIDKALAELRREAQQYDDPDAYFDQHAAARRRPIERAQRAWEQKQSTAWEAELQREAAEQIAAARKQHPTLRQRYAEHLVAERGLPKKAVEELLKITNTDDMPVFADSLAASVKAHAKTRRQANQDKREAAAKAAPVIASPSTGRPRSQKPPEYKGEAKEWLAMRRQLFGR